MVRVIGPEEPESTRMLSVESVSTEQQQAVDFTDRVSKRQQITGAVIETAAWLRPLGCSRALGLIDYCQ